MYFYGFAISIYSWAGNLQWENKRNKVWNLACEAQAGIKIAGRSISNLRYIEDTILMAQSEDLKSLLLQVKEESEKVSLKVNI